MDTRMTSPCLAGGAVSRLSGEAADVPIGRLPRGSDRQPDGGVICLSSAESSVGLAGGAARRLAIGAAGLVVR
jgi:hypothetical protein